MTRLTLRRACCACIASLIVATSSAAVVDLRSVPMAMDSNTLSFVANGVAATAAGYHAEYDATNGSTTIYGPFTTATVESSPSFLWPGFGRKTQLGFPGEPDIFVQGLGLQASEDLGQSDQDLPTANVQPGLDNMLGSAGGLPSIQFAIFSFDSPVTVSQVIVDDESNFGRAIWVAGSNTAPDLAQDFVAAFAGYSFINSNDDNQDGFFTHTYAPLQGIQYLVVGTPPDSNLIGDLGPLTGGEPSIQFHIEGLNIAPVPVPAAAWLFTSALGLLGWSRRKPVCNRLRMDSALGRAI